MEKHSFVINNKKNQAKIGFSKTTHLKQWQCNILHFRVLSIKNLSDVMHVTFQRATKHPTFS